MRWYEGKIEQREENAVGNGEDNFKEGGQSKLNKETSEQRFPSKGVSHADTGSEEYGGRAL